LKKKEGFDDFVNFFTETLPGVADDAGDAALKPVLDLLRSIRSDFESINNGVNNLENEVLSGGERIDLIIRKRTSEITGEKITKGESLQRNQGTRNIKILDQFVEAITNGESLQRNQGTFRNAIKKAEAAVAAQPAAVAAQPAAVAAQPAAVAAQPAAVAAQSIFKKTKKKF
jgi:hypothetical protein